MSRVVALSKYGFKLDSLRNDWEKVDKSLLKRDIFISLKKDDIIEVRERNSKGFIMDMVKVDPITNLMNNTLNALSKPVQEFKEQQDIKATDKERQILKGQCLNLAFKNTTEFNILTIKKGINDSKLLLKLLEDDNIYNW